MRRKAIVRAALLYAPVFALALFVNLSLFNYVDDDAYIHFRIAENLLRHWQPYFNLGEPVMASSSSCWTIVLLIIFSVFGMKLKAVSVFNALVTTLDVIVYARLAGELTGRDDPSNDLLAALVVVPVLATSSAGLMETPLAMLVLGIGVIFYVRRKGLAFLFMAACVSLRLELAVFLVFFLAHSLYTRRIPASRMLVYVAAGAAPFLIYDLAFFGTIMPHAVIAKKTVYSPSIQWFFFMAFPELLQGGIYDQAAELAAMLMLSAAAVTSIVKRGRGRLDIAALMMLSGFAVLLVYFLGKALVFTWYVPLYSLPVFFSLFVYSRYKRSAVFALLVAVSFSPFLWDFGHTVYASAFDRTAYRQFENGARTRKYLEVGARLRDKYPDYTLMSPEIGGLGYGFKGYIYDACGLASEGALKYHPMKVPEERQSGALGAIPPGYVEETRPDIIVTYDVFADAIIRSGVIRDYIRLREDIFTPEDMVRVFRYEFTPEDKLVANGYEFWGGGNLNVFIRRDKYLGAF